MPGDIWIHCPSNPTLEVPIQVWMATINNMWKDITANYIANDGTVSHPHPQRHVLTQTGDFDVHGNYSRTSYLTLGTWGAKSKNIGSTALARALWPSAVTHNRDSTAHDQPETTSNSGPLPQDETHTSVHAEGI